jgi:hypothetical protein
VKLDRLRRQEQGGGGLLVRRSAGDDEGDLKLLCSELVGGSIAR